MVEERLLQVERDVRNVLPQVRESGNRLDVLRRSEDVARRSYDIRLAHLTTEKLPVRTWLSTGNDGRKPGRPVRMPSSIISSPSRF
ncbi:MAG: hypothetical protein QGI34_03130 [Candidatus Latescibacteria bacterium]|nr:hypothetical protein [Candidatus Latescibacterota bacterium]